MEPTGNWNCACRDSWGLQRGSFQVLLNSIALSPWCVNAVTSPTLYSSISRSRSAFDQLWINRLGHFFFSANYCRTVLEWIIKVTRYMITTQLYDMCSNIRKQLQTCASSEDSSQPAHLYNLLRTFTKHILDSQGCKVSCCGQWILWSDCTYAQAD